MKRTLSRRKVWTGYNTGNPRVLWRVIWNIREVCWLRTHDLTTVGTIVLGGMKQDVIASGHSWATFDEPWWI